MERKHFGAKELYKLAVAANANLWLRKLNLQSISITLRHLRLGGTEIK